jgi:AhpD family alkylhydroperoxidase
LTIEKTAEMRVMSCGEENRPSAETVPDAGGAKETEAKFFEFLKSSAAPGALDAKTKQAVAIALSVFSRCEPCAKSHLKKARDMGFSQEEIDEAGWMAVSFGGTPAMTFFKSVRRTGGG